MIDLQLRRKIIVQGGNGFDSGCRRFLLTCNSTGHSVIGWECRDVFLEYPAGSVTFEHDVKKSVMFS